MRCLAGVLCAALASARMTTDKGATRVAGAATRVAEANLSSAPLAPPEECPLRATFDSAMSVFRDLRVPAMLAYGTAVGFARSQTLNCGAAGVDLAVFSADLLKLGPTLEDQKARIGRAAMSHGFGRLDSRSGEVQVRQGADGTAATTRYRFLRPATWLDWLLRKQEHGLLNVYVLHSDGVGGVWEFAESGRHFINRGRHFRALPPAAFALPAGVAAPEGVELQIMPEKWLSAAYGPAWRRQEQLTVHSDVFLNAQEHDLTMPSASYVPLGHSAQSIENAEQGRLFQQRWSSVVLAAHRCANVVRRSPGLFLGTAALGVVACATTSSLFRRKHPL